MVAYQVVSECSVHSGAPPALPAPVRRASRCALGADGAGAARPGACSEPDRRLALRAWRRGRCVPLHQAGQPLAAIAASRYALGPDGMRAQGRLRQPGRGLALRARRRRRGRCGVRAPAPAPQGGRKRRNKIRTTRRNITSNKYIPVQSAHATYVPRLLRLSTSLACAARRGKSVYLGLSRPGSHLPSA